jgi:hypothetical protein
MKKIALVLAVLAAVAAGWAFRYQSIGGAKSGAEGSSISTPLVLNRWTGTVYVVSPSHGLETCAQAEQKLDGRQFPPVCELP